MHLRMLLFSPCGSIPRSVGVAQVYRSAPSFQHFVPSPPQDTLAPDHHPGLDCAREQKLPIRRHLRVRRKKFPLPPLHHLLRLRFIFGRRPSPAFPCRIVTKKYFFVQHENAIPVQPADVASSNPHVSVRLLQRSAVSAFITPSQFFTLMAHRFTPVLPCHSPRNLRPSPAGVTAAPATTQATLLISLSTNHPYCPQEPTRPDSLSR